MAQNRQQPPAGSDRALIDEPSATPNSSPGDARADALQGLFERVLDHLRGLKRWRRDAVIPVQVDLVGEENKTSDRSQAITPSAFSARSAEGNAPPPGFTSQAWSFQDAVVLRRTTRSSRLLLYVVLGFTGSSLLWMVVAPLNQTVLVQGKLEPDTRVKTLKAPVAGVVDSVLVKEGESVNRGDILLRFDVREAESQLENSTLIRQQLIDENNLYAASLGSRSADDLSPEQRERFENQRDDVISRQQSAAANLAASKERLQGYKAELSTIKEIKQRYESLVDIGAVSIVQVLQQRSAVEKLLTKIREEEQEVMKFQAELRRAGTIPQTQLRDRIDDNTRLIHLEDQRIAKAQLQLQYGVIEAPTEGRVFDLDVRPGSVTMASEPLVKVVPNDALQARVYVPSSSIGFIQPGQKADISLDTFPSADYGRLEATVARVSTDALTSEESKEQLGEETSGLSYPAVLKLEQQHLQAGQRQIPLQPGMSLKADIHLRQRRFIQVITGFFEDKLRSLERMR